MDRYLEMQTFCAVVDSGSFVKASEQLKVSKAAVSRYISDLEARLGVRLLQRTTRRMSLTEEGILFNERCKHLLSELEDAENEVSSRGVEVSGLIRVNAPVTFGIMHLAQLWDQFHLRHPKVQLDVTLSDQIVDLLDDSYDLAIRIAKLSSSSMISKQLSSTRVILCASPRYLELRGLPEQPLDLVSHETISYSNFATGSEWQFDGPEGPSSVKIKSWMHSNNGETCVAMAIRDQGIILQPSFLVAEAINRGELVEVLPEYKSIQLGIYAVYPSRKHIPLKTRALVEFLNEKLQQK
tara:strand:+ start:3076 stop:3963 length:888 start_codon:yes stop_codon:yes gene_type:complete